MSDDRRADDPAERRAAATADAMARTGIDEDMIRAVVVTFYEHVRADAVLAPIFAARIEDWPPHIERACAFWSSVVLHTGRYGGRPMQMHARLPVSAAHFDRWLALFEPTVDGLCPPIAATEFKTKARMIAASLELGVASFRGQTLPPGARLSQP